MTLRKNGKLKEVGWENAVAYTLSEGMVRVELFVTGDLPQSGNTAGAGYRWMCLPNKLADEMPGSYFLCRC